MEMTFHFDFDFDLTRMDPFHAKLVAAATGSTLTALTSMVFLNTNIHLHHVHFFQ